jgi:hypothetical protein
MRKYIIDYRYADGFEGEVEVHAEDRLTALETFESFASEDVIRAECVLADEDDEEEE